MAQPLWLRIEGARQNNLKNVSLAIPHDRVTVITGVSGSGKSSLAFDTIFAEGQWRYIESLSAYARMFLERLDRPDVDRIEHIRPAIALEQKNPVRTARSTVGTATELHDYLRLLFAKVGRVHCPRCDSEARSGDSERGQPWRRGDAGSRGARWPCPPWSARCARGSSARGQWRGGCARSGPRRADRAAPGTCARRRRGTRCSATDPRRRSCRRRGRTCPSPRRP